MLKAVAATLRQRIVAEVRPSVDEKDLDGWPMMRNSDGTIGEAWPHFILEQVAGYPEYRDWTAGRLPILSEKYLRTSQNVMRRFKNWLVNKKVGRVR